jgi:hypothetical protein
MEMGLHQIPLALPLDRIHLKSWSIFLEISATGKISGQGSSFLIATGKADGYTGPTAQYQDFPKVRYGIGNILNRFALPYNHFWTPFVSLKAGARCFHAVRERA